MEASSQKLVLCMFFLVVLLVLLSCEATINTTSDDDGWSMKKLEVQKLLKSLNKPPVKSIKSVDGDIIDCVDILHQPGFDHPDLKNHKIQMRPNSYPKGITFDVSNISSNSKPLRQLWHKSGRCPEGTIPIRRTKKDDILRANSIEKFGKKEQGRFPQPKSAQPTPYIANYKDADHEWAAAYVRGEKYFGGKATINVWNPQLQQPDEFSLSQIWVVADVYKNKNTIEAGWMVYPKLFGDNRTRLFIYWTSDGYTSTGCYNLVCHGFIQTSKDITLGGAFNPVSKYGSSQYHVDIMIWKEPETKNWWLRYGNDNVGYWPASLFTKLDYASSIRWGGEILNSKSNGHHTSTQMGSGHFPHEGYGKASYFDKIQIVTGANILINPTKLITFTSEGNCYGIDTETSELWNNTYFYYGGPGRNFFCP